MIHHRGISPLGHGSCCVSINTSGVLCFVSLVILGFGGEEMKAGGDVRCGAVRCAAPLIVYRLDGREGSMGEVEFRASAFVASDIFSWWCSWGGVNGLY